MHNVHTSETRKSAGSLESRLDRHFLGCAAAAAAASAVLGNIKSADAAVTYSGLLNTQIPIAFTSTSGGGDFGYAYVDLLNAPHVTVNAPFAGSNYQFLFVDRVRSTAGAGGYYGVNTGFFTKVSNGIKVVGGTPFSNAVSKLSAGTTVSNASLFASGYSIGGGVYTYNFLSYDVYDGAGYFPWIGGTGPGYMGFKFNEPDGTHFGWMRIDIDTYSNGNVITIKDYAYDTTPGASIVTGAVPEPVSAAALGVLALGAVGIRPRREQAVA